MYLRSIVKHCMMMRARYVGVHKLTKVAIILHQFAELNIFISLRGTSAQDLLASIAVPVIFVNNLIGNGTRFSESELPVREGTLPFCDRYVCCG